MAIKVPWNETEWTSVKCLFRLSQELCSSIMRCNSGICPTHVTLSLSLLYSPAIVCYDKPKRRMVEVLICKLWPANFIWSETYLKHNQICKVNASKGGNGGVEESRFISRMVNKTIWIVICLSFFLGEGGALNEEEELLFIISIRF